MTREEFAALAAQKVVVLDGSSGVALQKLGMPKSVCPEQWAADNPGHLIGLQRDYISAGSDIIYTFTLGGSAIKLDEYGLREKTFELNKRLAGISREAAGKGALVAGDIGPCGHFPEPFGGLSFEDCVNSFKEQVKGLIAGGVGLFVIETFMDIQEARAALIAVKELCDLPVIVSMTFDSSGKTLTGADPVTALMTLEALGADSVGVNCSTGPAEMAAVVKAMKPYASVPIIAKPNAGLPKLVNGETRFDMGAQEFCSLTKPLVDAGAGIIGGCCGTTPEFISLAAKAVNGLKPPQFEKKRISALTSARKTVFPGKEFIIIGERINPTGKKQLQAELKEGKEAEIRRFASEQAAAGALVLDVNTGMPGIDEKDVMLKTVKLLSTISTLPLCIDSSSPDVIEAALRIYPGRALVNSISAERDKAEKLLPLAAKYGAMFILLPIDDSGIPPSAEERIKVIESVAGEAEKFSLESRDIVVDGLVMTVSSDPGAAKTTLEVIKRCAEKGLNTVIGLSNVSFGLPARHIVNSTFLALAKEAGLTMAIANPSAGLSVREKAAEELLLGRDEGAKNFIAGFSGAAAKKKEEHEERVQPGSPKLVYEAVLTGDRESISGRIDAALKAGAKPKELVDGYLIPAINAVGSLFEKREYFLPQLIRSAEAMKAGFGVLEPLLEADAGGSEEKAGVVIATVKGDIHDIGKNIVGLMLKNYGFKVYDLGKDIEAEVIVCLLYTSPSPRDRTRSRMPSSA